MSVCIICECMYYISYFLKVYIYRYYYLYMSLLFCLEISNNGDNCSHYHYDYQDNYSADQLFLKKRRVSLKDNCGQNFFPSNAFLRRRRKKALLRVNDRGGVWRMCILGLCRVYVCACVRVRARLQLTYVAMTILRKRSQFMIE